MEYTYNVLPLLGHTMRMLKFQVKTDILSSSEATSAEMCEWPHTPLPLELPPSQAQPCLLARVPLGDHVTPGVSDMGQPLPPSTTSQDTPGP